MEFICQHCNKILSTNSALNRHIKTNARCLRARGELEPKKPEPLLPCPACHKTFSRKDIMKDHFRSCKLLLLQNTLQKENTEKISFITEENKRIVVNLKQEIDLLKQKIREEYLRGRMDATREINDNLVGLDIAQSRVKALEKKYLRKQKRDVYPDKYVVYLITNEDLLKKRTYIIGSATCLQNRLSTYNKSAEHTVSYFSKCYNKEKMKLLETIVLTKLEEYKEVANRDRFVLPEGKNKDFFIDTMKETEKFLLS